MSSHNTVEERPVPFLQVLTHVEGTGCEYPKACGAEKWEVCSDLESIWRTKTSVQIAWLKTVA